ncbi:MAG: hypothetical protein CVV44_22850 [Spirochaetae bacterium HGW-Spirochaetae-1]|nr:MAG: hypothetical protein CVV44_22850 [Spirochaetae bacterium HGW-Spirochaetae-1]
MREDENGRDTTMGGKMAKLLYRTIEKIEEKENIGPFGEWRREFCGQYREVLIRARDKIYNDLENRLASKGEEITCRKGCTYCCFHYVAVPLAHGIVIVDYLYQRKKVLRKFIGNYQQWFHEGHAVAKAIDETRIHAFSSSMPIDDIIAVTRPFSMRYLEMNIPCPFLEQDACLIYAVRPLPCSGHHSVSPPEWCSFDRDEEPVIHHLIADDEDLLSFLDLAGPRLMVYELTLPVMIYRLLTEGSASLIQSTL